MSTDMQEISANRFPSIIEKFYLNEDLADFHFLFKINEDEDKFDRVPAHKLLLTASDVFQTMFNGDWKDKTEVEIVDASLDNFKEFLKFFYLSKANLTFENVGFVMNLGNKYNVQECLTVCSKFLTDSINEENVCTAYGLSSVFHQEKLRKYCELIIGTNTKAVLSSNAFLESDRDVLKNILNLDYIPCSEFEIFEACMNWVKFKSVEEHLTRDIVQEHLGNVLYDFRFKSMSTEEFGKHFPAYVSIFTYSEYVEISQLVIVDTTVPNLFSVKQRIENLADDGPTLQCFRLLSNKFSLKPYKLKEIEVTTFSVSEPVLLKGIECTKLSRHTDNAYYVIGEDVPTEMEILLVSEQSGRQILCHQSAKLESKNATIISLSTPILIRPNLMYEIRLKQFPPANSVTGDLYKSEVKIDSTLTVNFHRDALVDGDWVSRGLIYALSFKKI